MVNPPGAVSIDLLVVPGDWEKTEAPSFTAYTMSPAASPGKLQ